MSATLDPKLRQGIGASESACLFGLNPYMTPLDLYARIVGLVVDLPTQVQKRGAKAERYIADEYADREGLFLDDHFNALPDDGNWLVEPPTQRHPHHAILIASPDRLVVRNGAPARLLEIKTARSHKGWEDPDEMPDGVPPHVMVQVQHQLLVGVEWNGEHFWPDEAHVAACVGHLDDYRIYTIKRSETIGLAITEKVEAFWSEHVEPRIPPAFDGSAAGDALLKALYPADARPALVAVATTHEANAIMAELKMAQAEADRWQAKADTAKQIVKSFIGDGAGIEGDGWRATWKRNKDSEVTDWKAVAQALAPSDALIAAHTTTKAGARTFRPSWRNQE